METPPKPGPTHKLLVLEDGVLSRLSSDAKLAAEFPALARVKAALAPLKGCAPCQERARRKALDEALQAAKASLAGMPADRKVRLKEALAAEKVRLVYRDGDRVVELTF